MALTCHTEFRPVEGSLGLIYTILTSHSDVIMCVRLSLTAEDSQMLLFIFVDDAEVQRQKMVPVLISDRCSHPPAHSDPSHPPPIRCLPRHWSLQAVFTGTAGIFPAGKKLDSDLGSVLGWSLSSRCRRKPPQWERNKGVHIYALIPLFSGRVLPCPSLTLAKMSLLRGHEGAGEQK